ncbi:putative disease resistance protein At4g27220 [Tasmannia lanceolata]|uniref:putative disease resistance protein At4g27220 n=1 Tax=Tasmannia lanceolata TaxID=3420 RepID=UPI0040633BA8
MNLLVTPAMEIGKYVFNPIKLHMGYFIHYKKNVKNLKSQMENLERKKNDILILVEAAIRRLEEPTEEVQQWLKRIHEIECDVRRISELVGEHGECLNGLCSNWRSHYRLGKEAVRKLVVVNELQEQSNFNRISHDLFPPSIEFEPAKDFEAFESTKFAMKQVMDALSDEKIYIVGVYGMGGVGKTTLMKEVGKLVKKEKIYEEVVMVTVSQKPDVKKIQGEIAEKLGLPLREESESVRAGKLFKRLKQKKTVLMVLDDVWERLELVEVGIPFGEHHMGCKIVLTSRSLNVCNIMESQAKIRVEVLSEQDSWDLFKKKAGDVVNSPNLHNIPVDVVKECGGLPLAVVTLGRALRDKDQLVWTNALNQLRRSTPTNIEGMHSKVFSSLMLSYNSLESEETKSCLLFCCLFPEDYNISVDKLMRYMTGEGFFRDVDTLEEASGRVHTFLDKLKASCLLLDGDKEGYVKMHDLVRDVAISISSRDGLGFVVKAGLGLREWQGRENIDECKRISLMCNKISILPDQPKCPQLLTLLLQNNWSLEKIPDTFFEGMKGLAVLDLSNTRIASLPPSLPCLTNLQTLRISKCHSLSDVSQLGGFKKLEILRLNGSRIYELQEEIGRLTNLRLLDLSNIKSLKRVPPNVISKLTHLEQLYMGKSFSRWEVQGRGDGVQASFSEVASLVRLNALYIHVKNVECLSQDIYTPWNNLTKFCICFDEHYMTSTASRTLRLNISTPISNWVKVLLERSDELFLVHCEGLENLVKLDAGGFNGLERLWIKECNKIEYLFSVDEMSRNAFWTLKELYLDHMENLKTIFHGPLPDVFLRNLRVLSICCCVNLLNIIPSDLLIRLQCLETLVLEDCDELQEVFHFEGIVEGHGTLSNLRELKLKGLPKLLSVWNGEVPLESLHNLEDIYVGQCKSLRILFSPSQAQRLQQMSRLVLEDCDELQELFHSEGIAEGMIMISKLKELKLKKLPKLQCIWKGVVQFGSLHNLEDLYVGQCHSLRNLFSPSQAQRLQQLQRFTIKSCDELVEIISNDEEKLLVSQGSAPPQLSQFKLLPPSTFENLRQLYIYNCKSFKNLFSVRLVRALQCLEELKVENCRELEGIIPKEEEEGLMDKGILPQLRTLVLCRLPMLMNFYQGVLLLDFPSLEYAKVWICPNLKRLPLGHGSAPKLKKIEAKKDWFEGLEWEDEVVKSRFQSLYLVVEPVAQLDGALCPNYEVGGSTHAHVPNNNNSLEAMITNN